MPRVRAYSLPTNHPLLVAPSRYFSSFPPLPIPQFSKCPISLLPALLPLHVSPSPSHPRYPSPPASMPPPNPSARHSLSPGRRRLLQSTMPISTSLHPPTSSTSSPASHSSPLPIASLPPSSSLKRPSTSHAPSRPRPLLVLLSVTLLLAPLLYFLDLPLPRPTRTLAALPANPSATSTSHPLTLSTSPAISSVPHSITNTTTTSSSSSTRSLFTPPSPNFPHACHIVGHNPHVRELWPFNARAFCLTSSLCLRPSTPTSLPHLYVAATSSSTTCALDTPDFISARSSRPLNCTWVQHKHVYLAHGRFRGTVHPIPPVIQPLSQLSNNALQTAQWLPGVVIIVPPFPFLANIFHFSFVAQAVTHVVTNLIPLHNRWRSVSFKSPPRDVLVVFRAVDIAEASHWRHRVWDILVRRRMQASGDIVIRTMNLGEDAESPNTGINESNNSNQLICMNSSVLLGNRGNVNLWPFANSSELPLDGSAVATESLLFRRAVYDELRVQTRLPGIGSPLPETAIFDLPPLVLGYSQRNALPDPPKGGYITANTTRRLNDRDEQWFQTMLKEEAARANVEYKRFRLNGAESFEEQVRLFEGIGFLIGIHGANLMNAIFMRPFGALMELMPWKSVLSCYVAGANSGLAYAKFQAAKASPQESRCPPWRKTCWNFNRERLVKIGEESQRMVIREMVREKLKYLTDLHRRFPQGVPVRRDRTEGRYVVVQ